jgi:hypothetical protein
MSIWYLIVPAAAIGAKALFGKSETPASVDQLAAKAVPIAQQEIAKGVPAAQAIDYAAKAVQVGTTAKAPTVPPPLAPILPQNASPGAPLSKVQAYANAEKVKLMMEGGIQNQPLPVVPQYALSDVDLPKPSPGWEWKRMTFEGTGPNSGKFWVYSSTSNWATNLKLIQIAQMSQASQPQSYK